MRIVSYVYESVSVLYIGSFVHILDSKWDRVGRTGKLGLVDENDYLYNRQTMRSYYITQGTTSNLG